MTKRKKATGGVRKRGTVWWIWYHVDGKRHDESSGSGDERVARSLLAQRRREIREGIFHDERAPLTVERYLEDWLARRETSGVRTVRNEKRFLRSHVIPELGQMRLADVKRRHVRDVVQTLSSKTSDKTGKPYSPRTILHVYRALATAFQDAVLDDLIPATPCTLRTRKGELPRKRDQDPAWRAQAVYTRNEAEALISDARLPLDRRVIYGMMLLGGLRIGEARGRRWTDYDREAEPLGRLKVATQADGEDSRGTKTGETRDVPVHPALASLLAEWRRDGFPQLFGRHPRPTDPIVPSRGYATATRFRSKSATYDRLRDDVKRIGLRRVPHLQHAMRSTFLSLLELDGANMAIARRATHAAPADVVGGYIRVQWVDVCREVSKLSIELRRGVVVPLRSAASGPSTVTETVTVGKNTPFSSEKLVGGAGFESSTPHVIAMQSGELSRTDGSSKSPKNTGERTPETQTVTHVTDSEPLAAQTASAILRQMAADESDRRRRAALSAGADALESDR